MLAFREEKKGLEGEIAVGRLAQDGWYLRMSLRSKSRRVGENGGYGMRFDDKAGRGAISDSLICRVFVTLVSTEAATRMKT